MKILLIVQRESGCDITPWVAEAVDEYTLDEWNGALPTAVQAVVDADPANTRKLWVTIPDGTLEKLWEVPTTEGKL